MTNFIELHDVKTGLPMWINMNLVVKICEHPDKPRVTCVTDIRHWTTYEVRETQEEIFKKMSRGG